MRKPWTPREEPTLSVLSIDLAHKDYADIGVCVLRQSGDDIEATPVHLASLGLTGEPDLNDLAATICNVARQHDVRLVLIDGPQAWKSPDNGLLHSRRCERELATPGKTGVPGVTKPGNYAWFITFAIELFDLLADLGWPRLPNKAALTPTNQFALESFPTSAWRYLGLTPLPGKGRTPHTTVQAKSTELCKLFPLSCPNDLTHDELQAIVAGLAGIAAEGHPACQFRLSGIAPFELDGFWREGFIINPVRINSHAVVSSST
jgi:hypothetical protein